MGMIDVSLLIQFHFEGGDTECLTMSHAIPRLPQIGEEIWLRVDRGTEREDSWAMTVTGIWHEIDIPTNDYEVTVWAEDCPEDCALAERRSREKALGTLKHYARLLHSAGWKFRSAATISFQEELAKELGVEKP